MQTTEVTRSWREAVESASQEAGGIREVLKAAGFRIEGPGQAVVDGPADRYWWTLGRPGWCGYETAEKDFDTEEEAMEDALRALQSDEDIDWSAGRVNEPLQFGAAFLRVVKRASESV